jgi:2,5-furandicarboxylate decarboxylase 1
MAMAFDDLRQFLATLEHKGLLQHVSKPVSAQHEIGAIGRRLCDSKGRAIVLTNVVGFEYPVVMNIFGTDLSRIALALGCAPHDLTGTWLQRATEFLKPTLVQWGPCHENVGVGDNAQMTGIVPQIVWNGSDGGPYITFGLLFCKDPETMLGNMSIYRLMIAGERRLTVNLGPPRDAATAFLKAERCARSLDVAIVIGADPVLYLASQAPLAYGSYELELAGALRQAPVEVVKCKTVDLEVPATSEIVLEGRLLPNVRDTEGPFGDFTGHVSPAGLRPVIEITAVTYRNDPLYLCTYAGSPPTEEHLMHSLTNSAERLRQLRESVAPMVKDVFFPLGGCSEFHVRVALRQEYPGQSKNVILDLLKNPAIKSCVVVDEDIDIRDSDQVEWAVATRVRPDRDIVIVSDMAGHPLDHSQPRPATSSKYGIDATVPFAVEFPPRVQVNDRAAGLVDSNWTDYFPNI